MPVAITRPLAPAMGEQIFYPTGGRTLESLFESVLQPWTRRVGYLRGFTTREVSTAKVAL